MSSKALPCTQTLNGGDSLQDALQSAEEGAVICLGPGTYTGPLVLERSVRIRRLEGIIDAGDVVIDGDDRASVLAILGDGLTVHLSGVRLTGGRGAAGGAVSVSGFSTVVLEDLTIESSTAKRGGGGALYANKGDITLRRVRVQDTEGGNAPGVFADGLAEVRIEDSLIVAEAGPAAAVIRVRDGAVLTLIRSTVVAEGSGAGIHASGTSSRHPMVVVRDSIVVGGGVAIDRPTGADANVRIARSVVHPAKDGGQTDFGGTVRSEPGFAGGGDAPYRIASGGAARGIAQGGGASDLVGMKRPDKGATAGAFQ